MADKQDVLSRIPQKIHKDISVLSKKDLNRHVLYHISDNDRIKEFIPRITSRTLGSENRSIPRISCSLDIAGAIAGHSATEYMFSDPTFAGVFQLYALPFEYCVKPKAGLVADANQTREHWLTTYSRDTEVYVPIKLGRFFYESIRLFRPKQEVVYEMIVEILEDDVYLTSNKLLDKGYWRVVGRSPRAYRKHHATRKPMTIESMTMISKSEWKALKDNNVVNMEAFGDSAVMSW